MKFWLPSIAALALTACNATAPEKVEDVAANNMSDDDVTEVQDETVHANSAEIGSHSNDSNAIDAD